jgi:hypothetical protein
MVYTWAPQGNIEANRKLWAEQRAAVVISDKDTRANWSEAKPPLISVDLPNSYTKMSLNSRVWQEQKLPDEEKTDEPKAEDGPKKVRQFLGGNPSEDSKTTVKVTAGQNAFLSIYAIPKADTVDAAYTALETVLRKEFVPDDDKYEFPLIKDKDGKAIKGLADFGPGKIPGYLVRTDSDEGLRHQFVIAVIRQTDGKSVGLVFDMLLTDHISTKNRREFFDTEINAVLNSLVKK